MIANASFCLQMEVGGPSHKSLTLALEGAFQKLWQLNHMLPRPVVKEAFVFGLAVGGLCAPQHKWVSMSGRLWAAHTHEGAGPQRLLPWEEKEALCALAVLQGKYSCCSSVLNCSLFKEKSPDVKISSPLQHILATNSKSVAAFKIVMNL